jgi:hypothetical protein
LGAKINIELKTHLPDVSACLEKARFCLSSGSPQEVVSAAVLLATATRQIEREGFAKIIDIAKISGTDNAAGPLVQDSMEMVFDCALEALGHITVMGLCKELEDKVIQLHCAERYAGAAYERWSAMKRLVIHRGPTEIQ